MSYAQNSQPKYSIAQLSFTLLLLSAAIVGIYLGLFLLMFVGMSPSVGGSIFSISLLSFYVLLGVQVYRLKGSVVLWVAATFFTSPLGPAVAFWFIRQDTAETCALQASLGNPLRVDMRDGRG